METPASMEPCPSCETINDVTVIPDTAPDVRAWSYGTCGTDWALTAANPRPRPFLDHLAAMVGLAAARSVLRELITLAEQAPRLTDGQLRERLRALTGPTLAPDPRLVTGRTRLPGDQPVPTLTRRAHRPGR